MSVHFGVRPGTYSYSSLKQLDGQGQLCRGNSPGGQKFDDVDPKMTKNGYGVAQILDYYLQPQRLVD